MVVCDPGASIQDLRQLVKQDTGISVSSLTKQDICDAYASMGPGIVLPPMRMSRDGSYLIDVASPLEVKDYKVLFKSSSTIGELKSVARKVKAVVFDGAKKADVVRAIRDRLNRLNVAEPVQLHSKKKGTTTTKASRKKTASTANVPVTSNNVVNTKEMVSNAVAKEENRRMNANVKIANLQNKLNTTQDPTEKNAIRRNLNAMRAENAEEDGLSASADAEDIDGNACRNGRRGHPLRYAPWCYVNATTGEWGYCDARGASSSGSDEDGGGDGDASSRPYRFYDRLTRIVRENSLSSQQNPLLEQTDSPTAYSLLYDEK